jgi:chromate transporter
MSARAKEAQMTNASRNANAIGRKEIILAFLKLGATAYGGPAIMGIMQAELQEKRQWVTKERFVEGLSLVNMLPGAGATQLGIFLGYQRGGWWGGLAAGLCFVLPAFFIMLALAAGYAAYGAAPLMKGALYGMGPVVMGVFVVAIYRLGRSAAATRPQMIIALAAAAASAFGLLGIAAILGLAGATGMLLFHTRRLGATALGVVLALVALAQFAPWPSATMGAASQAAGLVDIGSFFFLVGALSFGGGLSMIAFIQEHVVNHAHWLTQQEFIDGLALGQLTPGPILMVAAYVGYKLAGVAGAAVGAAGIFLPSFILMLSLLPLFERARELVWTRAAMKGIGAAVIGVLGVSLFEIAPHALPDPVALVILCTSIGAMLVWRTGAIKLMAAGALLGALRSRLLSLPGLRSIPF